MHIILRQNKTGSNKSMIRKTNYVPKDFSQSKNTEKISKPKNNTEKDNRKIAIQSIENSSEKYENEKNEITEEKPVSKTEIKETSEEKEISAQNSQTAEGIPFGLLLAVILLYFNR